MTHLGKQLTIQDPHQNLSRNLQIPSVNLTNKTTDKDFGPKMILLQQKRLTNKISEEDNSPKKTSQSVENLNPHGRRSVKKLSMHNQASLLK